MFPEISANSIRAERLLRSECVPTETSFECLTGNKRVDDASTKKNNRGKKRGKEYKRAMIITHAGSSIVTFDCDCRLERRKKERQESNNRSD